MEYIELDGVKSRYIVTILVLSNVHMSKQVEAFSEMDIPDISKLVHFSIENMTQQSCDTFPPNLIWSIYCRTCPLRIAMQTEHWKIKIGC